MQHRQVSSYRLFALVVSWSTVLVILCGAGWAQTSSISGSVVDASGAVVAGASVTVENSDSDSSLQLSPGSCCARCSP